VDFGKAYDTVSWKFLEYMMERFRFCDKWINWITTCVFAGNLSVLNNGCPTNQVEIKKGHINKEIP